MLFEVRKEKVNIKTLMSLCYKKQFVKENKEIQKHGLLNWALLNSKNKGEIGVLSSLVLSKEKHFIELSYLVGDVLEYEKGIIQDSKNKFKSLITMTESWNLLYLPEESMNILQEHVSKKDFIDNKNFFLFYELERDYK